MSVVYLVRHGQASFGSSDYDKLSDLGEQQSEVLGKALRDRLPTIDRVVTGAMSRHRRTAEIALAAMGYAAETIEDPRWNEYDHEEVIHRHKPAYRNRVVMAADLARRRDSRRAFQEMFDQALTRWAGGEFDHEYAEPWNALGDRAQSALDDLIEQMDRSQSALVFTSGGAISALTAKLLGLPPSAWLNLNRVMVNGAVTKIVSGRGGVNLVSFNEHAHFEGEFRHLLSYR
ncbi:MAG TPA: histidine phosphatase family protein [Solirubrobacterales bacterium]|jgi:broad specificity phosphatase PhoE|nr:histidine phosphatase family protein [Solirubrobacterales bacterium]